MFGRIQTSARFIRTATTANAFRREQWRIFVGTCLKNIQRAEGGRRLKRFPDMTTSKTMTTMLSAAELRERNARSLAAHQLNKARAEQSGDLEGVRIATLGILRCNAVANLLPRGMMKCEG